MTISSLNPENLKDFFPFFEKLMRENFPFYHPKVIDYFLIKIYSKQNLYYQLKNNQRIILVVYEDKQPLGFAMIDEPYGGVSFLRWLAVDKNHQGKGVGKMLVFEWEKIAKNQGCHKMELAAYPLVSSFYERCGFEKEGLRKMSYFGVNQVVMGKIIGEVSIEKITK
jgi:ribosomal protein S18 acetylase RimI-like enzyme